MTTKKRNSLPDSAFLGSGRSFPANDANHARLAISGATRAEHAGNISESEKEHIQSAARSRLAKYKSSRAAN